MSSKQWVKILEVMLAPKDGKITKADLEKALDGSGVVLGRMSTYLWEVETKGGAKLEKVKEGRKVTAYKITNRADVIKARDAAAKVAKEAAAKPVKSVEPKAKVEKPAKKAPAAAKPVKAAPPAKNPALVKAAETPNPETPIVDADFDKDEEVPTFLKTGTED